MRHRMRNRTFVDDGRFVYLNPPPDAGSGQQNVMPPPPPPIPPPVPYPIFPYAIPVTYGYPPIYEDEIVVVQKPEVKPKKKNDGKLGNRDFIMFGIGIITVGVLLNLLKK